MSVHAFSPSPFACCSACKTSRTCKTFRACYALARAKRYEAEKPRPEKYPPFSLKGPAIPSLDDDMASHRKREADHIERLIAKGGFPRAVVSHGKTWWQNGAGEMWTGGRW